jgi:putative pyruvate formate lyase activating enzyme
VKPDSHKQATARAESVRAELRKCTLCPRQCKVNRIGGERGYCGLDDKVRVFREMLHPYEERIINPSHQIYFAGCNLRCMFCTVAEWNKQPEAAKEIDYKRMAIKVKERREQGAKVLNLLGGEPVVSLHGVLELLDKIDADTTVVLNSNMYYSEGLSSFLDGLVDIYLADFKCGNNTCAGEILESENYLEIVCDNILAASQQSDVILRHLILPGHFMCCTKNILNWVSKEIPGVKLSLRPDYAPPGRHTRAPNSYLDESEYDKVLDYSRNLGLNLI